MKPTKHDEGLFLAALIIILFTLAVLTVVIWLGSVICG